MSVIGTSTNWSDLIDPMLPAVLNLVISSWHEMPSPAPNEKEDNITNALWRILVQNRTARGLMFQIRTQVVELDPAQGEDEGRMDIAFIALVPREDIYFCLEAKRLNVLMNGGHCRALASEYVIYGMSRFVTGQYSKAVLHGGMIGYVLDGNVPSAISNVEANIQQRRVMLGMASPGSLSLSSVLPSDARARETKHQRAQSTTLFSIHHLFMAAQ